MVHFHDCQTYPTPRTPTDPSLPTSLAHHKAGLFPADPPSSLISKRVTSSPSTALCFLLCVLAGFSAGLPKGEGNPILSISKGFYNT